jgi:hypothetical protein
MRLRFGFSSLARFRRWLASAAGGAPRQGQGPGLGDRGSVPVEYIAVFAFVSIGLAISFVKLGPTLLDAWGTSQHVLLANKP